MEGGRPPKTRDSVKPEGRRAPAPRARSAPPSEPSRGAPPEGAGLPDGHRPERGRPPRGPVDWPGLSAAGVLALALLVRVFGLGTQPLQPGEAANALQSLSILQGQGGSASAGPLLIYGNALVFLLFGASDAAARLLPALVGTGLVALPLLLERELGRVGSRVAMLLLAVSPTLVYFSRQADASILAATAALAVVAFGASALRGKDARPAYAAAASAGLLLTTGPLAYYALVPFAGYFLLRSVAGRSRPPAPARRLGVVAPLGPDFQGASVLPPALRDRSTLLRAGLVVAATWLVATTGLLTNPHGVQEGVVDGLDGWLRSFAAPSGASPLVYGAVLVGYELPSLVFGLLGAVRSGRRGSAFAGFLTWWALVAFLLGSVGAERPLDLAPMLVVPLALLAGWAAGEPAPDLAQPRFRADLGWFALGGVIVLAGLGIALDHLSTQAPVVSDAVLALPLLAVGGGLAVAVQTLGGGRTLRLGLVFGFAVLLVLAWRASATLNYAGEANPGELFVRGATSPDVRALARDTAEVGDALTMGSRDRSVVVAPGLGDVAAWYLRVVPRVTIGGDTSGRPAIAVLSAESKPPRGSYAGQRYRVLSVGKLDLSGWKEVWRWFAYRELPRPPAVVDAVVYVKSAASR